MRHTRFVLAALLAAAVAHADEIPVGKKKVRGVIVKREGDTTWINTFNTRIPRVVHGTERFPTERVGEPVAPKDEHVVYLRALYEKCPPGKRPTADAEFAMGTLAESLKLDDVAARHWVAALRIDPSHAGATEKIDALRLKPLVTGDPRSNPALAKALDAWFATEALAERKKALSTLAREHGFPHDLPYMERVRRSREQPKGRRDDVSLTLESKENKGVYTIFVPKDYDPLRPWPLVFGLHGGGADGRDGKDVVGSGRSAMNFYQSGAARYGYIVVCPSAIRAPWAHRMNDAFVLAVLDEVCLLYNIDMNRIYLTGHSMGGYGTWHYGPRYAERWAAISPMAGGGHNGLGVLEKTKTPVYLYHGADDQVVGCGDSRRAGESMRAKELDFVYAEIPDSGHGFPREVCEEMWSFFAQRRLAATPRRTRKGRFRVQLEPYSSFEQKVSRAERLYFGAPGEDTSGDKKTLLARIKLGGGAASDAADALIELRDKSTVSPLAGLLKSKKVADDVKAQAIRALGGMRLPEAVKPLTKSLRKLSVDLVPAAADALAALGDRTAAAPLAKLLGRIDEEFESRRLGASMAFSDWKRCMEAYTAVATALGALGDASTVDAMQTSADAVLLRDWKPRSSERARLNPRIPLGRAVGAMIDAATKLGGDKGNALATRLREKHGGLPGVK